MTLLSGVKMMLCWLLVFSRLIPGSSLYSVLVRHVLPTTHFLFNYNPDEKRLLKSFKEFAYKTQNIWREITCFNFSFKDTVI